MFTDPGELDQVNDLIHDCWFPVTRLREEGTDLLIPFASQLVDRAENAMFDSILRVSNVRSWRLIDSAHVEIYDFFGVSFDGAAGRLTIEGNIPLTIEVDVDRFVVSTESPTN